jgi:hypothetical protein
MANTQTTPTGQDIVDVAANRFFNGQKWTYWYGGNGSTVYNWTDNGIV